MQKKKYIHRGELSDLSKINNNEKSLNSKRQLKWWAEMKLILRVLREILLNIIIIIIIHIIEPIITDITVTSLYR